MEHTHTFQDHAPAPLLNVIAPWSAPAQAALWASRALFHKIAADADIGPLDETLKWGQPSWRPVKPRTGSTLRAGWSGAAPDTLSLYVDCKTDLAATMRSLYPDLAGDGRRQIDINLTTPLPEQALSHLADMTFRYHLSRRRKTT